MRVLVNDATLAGLGSGHVGSDVIRSLRRIGCHVVTTAYHLRHGHPFWNWAIAPVRKLYVDQVLAPGLVRDVKADVLFSLGDTGTWRPPVPQVLLVQQAHLVSDVGLVLAPWSFRLRMRLMRRYLAMCLPRVALVIVQSEFMKRGFRAAFPRYSGAVRVIPSRISPDLLPSEQERDGLVATRATRHGRPRLVYAARSNPHKNHEILPAVATALAARELDVEILVTLKPDGFAQLRREAAQAGVASFFTNVGELGLPQLRTVLSTADAAIIPSRLESFGLTYLESMAWALPVVAADVPIAREQCAEAGHYAGPDDADGFAQRIADVLFAGSDSYREAARRARRRFDVCRGVTTTLDDRLADALRSAIASRT